MRILFSYEQLYPPYDEGVKNLAYMIYQTLNKTHEVKLIRDITYLPNIINSALIMPRLILNAIIKRPEKIVYIPKGALTFTAILKIWLASIVLGNKLAIVSVQRKILTEFQKKLVRIMRLKNVFTLSLRLADELSEMGIRAKVLPTGIDLSRFTPNTLETRLLRKKYSLPENKKILLHVGHIKESRNILWLQDIQKSFPDIQVVIIGSTATEQDNAVRITLEENGILILREAFSDICEIYQAADIYCFPVTELEGAMEIPLSVLEAMAVNLPIITTRFGRLPELFEEDEYYKYAGSSADIISILQTEFDDKCSNREKLSHFTWENTASTLLTS